MYIHGNENATERRKYVRRQVWVKEDKNRAKS